jgi:hypothetical protein
LCARQEKLAQQPLFSIPIIDFDWVNKNQFVRTTGKAGSAAFVFNSDH